MPIISLAELTLADISDLIHGEEKQTFIYITIRNEQSNLGETLRLLTFSSQ